MIGPLRRAHRRIFLILAVLLPLILAAALLMREPLPVQEHWPFEQP